MKKSEQIEELASRKPVLSLPVQVLRLKSLGETVKGQADEAMLEMLAERLNILKVHSFEVDSRVFKWKKNGVRIEGRVSGDVEQACVVTLKPVAEKVDETFEVILVPQGSPFARRANDEATGGELIVDPEGEDPPEEFTGDEIDVGSYAEEFFALGLNDYPRHDGAEFSGHVEDDGSEDESENPFAALAGLKDKLDP
ncbi:MAG: DUF177 domain-containing protein [Cohaesibacter sp.]|jgi:uncharacterized metal-binding protein YceD (DUF177 family)|nr:DUF177 domain-containing protein [Cohaesibacter sp.]